MLEKREISIKEDEIIDFLQRSYAKKEENLHAMKFTLERVNRFISGPPKFLGDKLLSTIASYIVGFQWASDMLNAIGKSFGMESRSLELPSFKYKRHRNYTYKLSYKKTGILLIGLISG